MEPQPQPQPQPRLGCCDLHPQDEAFAGGSFCPSCLRDRLSGLDASASSSNARLSTSALRVRSLFSSSSSAAAAASASASAAPPHPLSSSSTSHLRRCSSFSARPVLDAKPMKTHLDLESHPHSHSHSHSNFFTRKWHQWRTRPAHTKHPQCTSNASSHCPPRFSFDAPRPSWDGHSVICSRLHPLLSAPISRFDDQIPVEDNDSAVPGSQAHTRDYYLDSSSSNRRRRSFERSASLRKVPILPELETEHRSIPAFNSKVSPAGAPEFYQYHHAAAKRDDIDIDMSGSFSSAFPDPCKSQVAAAAAEKKQKKWSKGWNLWGLIQRKGNNKDQQGANVAVASGHADHLLRCNSSVSARSSFSSYSAAGSMRRNSVDIININSHANSKKTRDEFVLERNRSARFSPGQVDNGMLRLYLTPTRGSQSGRRSSGVRPVNTASQAMPSRPVHRLY